MTAKKNANVEVPKKRGRRVTGTAKTATERSKERDAALLASGGKIISRLRLSGEAAAALERVRERFADDRSAIEAGLIELDKITVALHDK